MAHDVLKPRKSKCMSTLFSSLSFTCKWAHT